MTRHAADCKSCAEEARLERSLRTSFEFIAPITRTPDLWERIEARVETTKQPRFAFRFQRAFALSGALAAGVLFTAITFGFHYATPRVSDFGRGQPRTRCAGQVPHNSYDRNRNCNLVHRNTEWRCCAAPSGWWAEPVGRDHAFAIFADALSFGSDPVRRMLLPAGAGRELALAFVFSKAGILPAGPPSNLG